MKLWLTMLSSAPLQVCAARFRSGERVQVQRGIRHVRQLSQAVVLGFAAAPPRRYANNPTGRQRRGGAYKTVKFNMLSMQPGRAER
jgi:hypothetical protein